jgi:hypothetical protein
VRRLDIEHPFGTLVGMTGHGVTSVNPPHEQLDLLAKELDSRVKSESAEYEGLDRKATATLAATGVVFGLVINNADQFAASLSGPRNLYNASLVLLVLGLVAGVRSMWPRRAAIVPKPRNLIADYYKRQRDDTLAALIATRVEAFGLNANIADGKLKWLRFQMGLLCCGGIALVVAFIARDWK